MKRRSKAAIQKAGLLLCIAVVLVVAGCAGGDADMQQGSANKDGQVDIRGQITNVNMGGSNGDLIGFILVEGVLEPDTTHDKAQTRIVKSTELYKLADGQWIAAAPDELVVGARVEVAFNGPVAESYPVQATAGRVVIIEAPSHGAGAVTND